MAQIKPIKVLHPLDFAFKRLGGKYKGRILLHLQTKSVMRYGELGRLLKDATPKMLTQSLKELEEDALVIREEFIEVPQRVEYKITALGTELIPLMRHLNAWGEMIRFRSECISKGSAKSA